MLHPHYLAEGWRCPLSVVIDHMEHVIRVAGEDFVSLGSDFDGMISLPEGFRDVLHMPKLVGLMLERGWSPDRIGKVMGGNFLRVLGAVRP